MRVLMIVPAFNEAKNLPRVIAALREHCPLYDLCVVDDGSVDATRAVARAAGALVLTSPLNLGIGGAVQTGYLWARERQYDVAVQIDGDGQHDPRFVQAGLKIMSERGHDLVIGSRFLDGSTEGFKSSAARRIGIRYLCWFLRVRCGVRVTDPTSGFRVASRRAIELFAESYPSDYPEPEAIALATRAGLSISEIAVQMRERQHGSSSITAWRSLYYLVKVSIALILLPPRANLTKGS